MDSSVLCDVNDRLANTIDILRSVGKLVGNENSGLASLLDLINQDLSDTQCVIEKLWRRYNNVSS